VATIKLKVDSNFSDASKDLANLGELTESEAKRIEKALKKLKGDEIDSFVQRNQRAAAAVRATDGAMAGLETEQAGLRREIQKLIRAGYDPQDAALKELKTQYKQTSREIEVNTRAQAANEQITKAANRAFLALSAAALAGAVAMGKNAVDVAAAGDEYAKTARTIGITAEDLQELQFVADRSGVSNEALNTALQKLNKNIGDVRAGTGSLTTLLKAQNPELLSQLQNVKSNDEAFALLTGEIGEMENATDRAALAQAAFGRAGQDLINVALLGADGIKELRDEARGYGLISNDAATASEEFIDAQTNALAAVKGIRNEMAGRMIPTMTGLLDKFTSFVTDSEKVNRVLNIMLPIIIGIAGGLASFLIITQVIAIVKGFSTAMMTLNAVLAANPVILIAAAIAVVIAAIVLLIRNWDKVVIVIESTTARLQARFEQFGVSMRTSWLRAINSLKIGFLELAGIILEKALGAVNKLLTLAGKIPFVGEKFQGLQENVNAFAAELNTAREEAIRTSEAAVQAAKDEQAAARSRATDTIAAVKEESAARLAALKEQEEANANMAITASTSANGADPVTGTPDPSALAERLTVLNNVEAMAQQERLATFGDFLNARMEQEEIAGEERIAFLQNELLRIQDLENVSREEKLAATQEVESRITEIQRQEAEERKSILAASLKIHANFFGAMSDLVTAFGKENEGAIIAAKGLASTQAAINSYLAFTEVLSDPFYIGRPWMRGIAAGAVLASGLAQQANIWKAETGGTFTVPRNPGSHVDNKTISVSEGEEVNVTPRGGNSSRSMTANFIVDKQVIWSIMQDGIDSNEVTFTNDNLRAG